MRAFDEHQRGALACVQLLTGTQSEMRLKDSAEDQSTCTEYLKILHLDLVRINECNSNTTTQHINLTAAKV